MKKKDYKELVEELNSKLNFANKTVCDLMTESYDSRMQTEEAEKYMRIAERELIAKERLIVELKIWIQDLIRGSE